jgi:hypothetical protein
MDRFPNIDVQSLLGERGSFPADLPAKRTIVVAAFLKEQQPQVDRWIEALASAGVPDTPVGLAEQPEALVIELPVLSSRYRMVRRFIDGGMTRGIGIPEILARTWTTYTDVDAFRKSLSIPSPRVEVMVVSRLGEVIDRASGEPSPESVERLAQAALN